MKVTVMGAGSTGLAMAAHAVEQGHRVKLWNRSNAAYPNLFDTQTIYTKGEIDGKFKLDLVTMNMEEALSDRPDIILITTPSFAHPFFAEEIAKHLKNDTIILLCPGRTYGAIEFIETFKLFNQNLNPTVAETQTAIYTCRKTNDQTVDILSIKRNVLFSALDHSKNQEIYDQLPPYIQKQLAPAVSIIETSIGSVGMIMHCAPLLLNTGWVENKDHEFKYYIEGITPSIATLLEKLDKERIAVAQQLGIKVEGVQVWLKRVYNVEGSNLYESIQNTVPYKTINAPATLNHRYITEDVPNGLVAVESTGHYFGLEMKYTGLIIDLASTLLATNFRKEGRNLESVFRGNKQAMEDFLQGSEANEKIKN